MIESTLHLAVALEGTGWHPAVLAGAGRPAGRAVHRRLLDRPGAGGRARSARPRHVRGLAGPAVRSTRTSPDDADRPGPRPAGRGADRGPGGAADVAHRAACRRWWSPTPSRSTSPRRSPPWTTSAPAGPASGCGSPAGRTRPRTSAGAPSRRIRLDERGARRRWPSCSTRPPTTSRWCAGCGTAGRTTRRSGTRRPAGSSTGTSCTTSTSAARTSRSRGPSITPRPPQGQPLVTALAHRTVAYRLLARSADLGFVTPADAADAAAILDRDPHRAGRRGSRRRPAARARRPAWCSSTTPASAAADRRARLDELAGAELTSDARIFTGTPAELADLRAGVARGRADRGAAAARRHRRTTCR